MANKTSNGQGAGWPSKTGNPSGGNRYNNPPRTSRPNTSKK